MFYSKKLNGSLKRFVEDALEQPAHQQLQLYEELAMTRDLAGRMAAMYEAACDLPDQGPSAEHKLRAVMTCGSSMQQALAHVADLATRISAIERNASDKISAGQMAFIVAQIVRIAYESMPEEYARCFEENMRAKIRVQTGPQGTSITPDQDAMEMDATIPGTALLESQTTSIEEPDGPDSPEAVA